MGDSRERLLIAKFYNKNAFEIIISMLQHSLAGLLEAEKQKH